MKSDRWIAYSLGICTGVLMTCLIAILAAWGGL